MESSSDTKSRDTKSSARFEWNTVTSKSKFLDCQLCGMKLLCQSALDDHMILHQDRKSCSTDDQTQLRSNVKSNARKKVVRKRIKIKRKTSFTCSRCRATFSQWGALLKHRRVHLDQHCCKLCKGLFRTVWRLREHEKSSACCQQETGNPVVEHPRKFACNVCGKRFVRLYNLKRHDQVHKQRKQSIRSSSSQLSALNRDISTESQHPLPAVSVQAVYNVPPSIQIVMDNGFKHVQTSPVISVDTPPLTNIVTHQCDDCELSFNVAELLRSHRLSTHVPVEEQFGCGICLKCFEAPSEAESCYYTHKLDCESDIENVDSNVIDSSSGSEDGDNSSSDSDA